MNIHFLLSMVLATFSMSSMAQVSNKLSVDAQMMLERASTAASGAGASSVKSVSAPDVTLPFIVRIDERRATETIEALRAAGAILHARIGSQLSAEIPASRLKAVEAIEGVVRIGTCGAAPKPMTNVTRKEIGISAIDGSEGKVGDQTYTGKGVTVAVIDMGFDFQHPAYKDSEGRSRIKAYYTPFDKGGNPVVIDGMQLPGSVFETPEQIARLTTDFPLETHGTHTSTIATGTRSSQGWGGMAPDADIVLCAYMDTAMMSKERDVETMMIYPTVFDALAFLKNYQEKSGKPMAVNMSIGNIKGPHNGRDEMPQAIRDFIAPGRLVSISSGNEGKENMHLRKLFKSDNDTLRTMHIGDILQLEGFTLTKAPLSAQVTIYEALDENGQLVYNDYAQTTAKWIPRWQSPVVSTSGNNSFKLNGVDNKQLAGIFEGELFMKVAFDETLDMTQLNLNILNGPSYGYAVELSVWSTAGTQIDFYQGRLNSFGRPNCTDATSELTVNNWSVAEKAVSVGNYRANTSYMSLFYEEQDEDDQCPVGDINPSSSYGIALNGRQIPMVAAPGTNVISAVSHFQVEEAKKRYNADMTWKGGFYNSFSGTSMSSPVVAGTLALWLQASPTLGPEEVEEILRETCRKDDFTAAKPERFGYGKLDAKKGLERILNPSGDAIHGIYEESESIRDKSLNSSQCYDLQGRPVSQPARGIYIKGDKKLVVR